MKSQNFNHFFSKKPFSEQGFSLLEIMIALAILSVSLLALYSSHGTSLKASAMASNIQEASLLARNKMAEQLISFEREQAKGSFPEDKETASGSFAPPYERYRWEWSVDKVVIPIAAPEGQAEDQASPGVNTNSLSEITNLVQDKLEESLRLVKLEVFWEELGSTESVTLTTHIVRL